MSKTVFMNGEAIEDRRKARNGEANKIVWWLLVTITGVAITGAWFWVAGVTTKINEIDAAQKTGTERITRLEEALKNLYINIGKIDGAVANTNTKLDRLLESWYRDAGPENRRTT